MLTLDPQHEHLRESLFWKMYGKTLLFRDIETANAYGKKLADKHESPPSMYSENHDRILSDGILDPTYGRSDSGKQISLRCVYGMQKPTTTALYQNLEAGEFVRVLTQAWCDIIINTSVFLIYIYI